MIQTVKDKNVDMIKDGTSPLQNKAKGSKHSKKYKEFIPFDMRNGLFSGDHTGLFELPLATSELLLCADIMYIYFFFCKSKCNT